MTEQEYLKTMSKLSDEVLIEELYLIIDNSCKKGCSKCSNKFCKLDVIREIIKERT